MTILASQSIQFVWFPMSVTDVTAEHVFQVLAGDDPDTTQRNKTPSAANPFLSVAEGVIGTKDIAAQVQPGRIDFTIAGRQAPEMRQDDNLILLDTASEISAVVKRFSEWGGVWPEAIRLSVVANLVQPTKDAAAATSLFFETLGIDVGFVDGSDPLFQINRRKAMDGYVMNRVVRFGVAGYQNFVFHAVAGQSGAMVPATVEKYGASTTLDINSVPDGRTIDRERQALILGQLAEELFRLGEHGTVRALVDS